MTKSLKNHEVVYVDLCESCMHEFPTCAAKKIVFVISRNPSAKAPDADKVLECDTYTPKTISNKKS